MANYFGQSWERSSQLVTIFCGMNYVFIIQESTNKTLTTGPLVYHFISFDESGLNQVSKLCKNTLHTNIATWIISIGCNMDERK